jgi:hypothetical protein
MNTTVIHVPILIMHWLLLLVLMIVCHTHSETVYLPEWGPDSSLVPLCYLVLNIRLPKEGHYLVIICFETRNTKE